MVSKFVATTLLALATCAPVQQAAAQDAVGGAIVGGILGGVVGGALGGRGGAAAGAILGAGTGAAIASQGEPRPGGYPITITAAMWSNPAAGWRCRRAIAAPRPNTLRPRRSMTIRRAACALGAMI